MTTAQKTKEAQVRRLAAHYGYQVKKSRQRPHYDNQGEYMLVDASNHIVQGGRFDASLDDIYRYIRAMEA